MDWYAYRAVLDFEMDDGEGLWTDEDAWTTVVAAEDAEDAIRAARSRYRLRAGWHLRSECAVECADRVEALAVARRLEREW